MGPPAAGRGDRSRLGRGATLPARPGGRERILDTAYELFSKHGTRAVGVDRINAEAGTAKMTLYRNFASKEELILAMREARWTRGWPQAEVERRPQEPADRLLAIFDVPGEWFARRAKGAGGSRRFDGASSAGRAVIGGSRLSGTGCAPPSRRRASRS